MPSELVLGDGGWPFWLGALALAGVSLAFVVATGGFLGVSGSYRRLVDWRAERARQATEAALPTEAESLEAMMLAATIAEFGPELAAKFGAESPAQPESPRPHVAPRLPLSVHAVFLGSLLLGGTLSALLSGTLAMHWQSGWELGELGPLSLVGGGVLVGFGTAMAGGCTSGHGLSGCSRLQPGSLVATGLFFFTGVGVTYLFGALS